MRASTSPARQEKTLHLAALYPTSLLHGWYLDGAEPERLADLDYHRDLVAILEDGKFDAIFAADFNSQPVPSQPFLPEPITLLAALAGLTKNIGLIGSISTTYNEPYNIARILASLDHLSRGRAGWNIVTSPFEGTAQCYGRTLPTHKARYERADEFTEIVVRLWDSWQSDAIDIDRKERRFFRPDRVSAIDYIGNSFRVSGALNIARSPQGRPVRFMAGTSEAGRDFAAKHADAVYVGVGLPHALRSIADDIKMRAERYNRSADAIRVFAAASIVIADTEAEARDIAESVPLWSSADRSERRKEALSDLLGCDLSTLNIDDPVPLDSLPPPSIFEGMQGSIKETIDYIKKHRPTIREFLGRESGLFVGTPLRLADHMQSLFTSGAADGFIVSSPMNRQSLSYFVRKVIPELQSRGIFRHEYEGTTLREHLQLPPIISNEGTESN